MINGGGVPDDSTETTLTKASENHSVLSAVIPRRVSKSKRHWQLQLTEFEVEVGSYGPHLGRYFLAVSQQK